MNNFITIMAVFRANQVISTFSCHRVNIMLTPVNP